ncbi:hypothetical protein O3S81_09260 [Agrobacterium sp. SOY23]|uniref:hypothetical protein n=1 Tax=Agrobacterium sp. SOY23 TaxID=3014555 RepID=UPI0022AEE134|nr:hypothetical protein [Agrobacterium sp. SOY23]MCZ4429884.1 hypothetical protein [Agrobacterium sp. SOY23]
MTLAINRNRFLMAGSVAGLALNGMNMLKNAIVPAFGNRWAAALEHLGIDLPGQMQNPVSLILFLAISTVYGFFAAWLYAAAVPRFGEGLPTALRIGVALWMIGYLAPMAGYALLGLFPISLVLFSAPFSLVEFSLCAILVSMIYRDHPQPTRF